MSQIYLKTIFRIYIFTALLISIIIFLSILAPAQADDKSQKLLNTNQFAYPEIPNSNYRPKQSCEGNWVWLPTASQRIDLEKISIHEWNFESKPAILKETENNNNKVLLGHNICSSRGCFEATTDFAQIIHLKYGDLVKACINNEYFESTVKISKQIPETATYILGDWLGGESNLTLFTCYGECKDEACQSSKDRWVVGL